MRTKQHQESGYYENQPGLGGIVSKVALRVRTRIFEDLLSVLQPTSSWRVLDAGVTSDQRPDSNFFERLYPYPSAITAIGLEDATFLETSFPGITFVKADACNLPFPDKSFDLAFCSAVIEHVGCRKNQLQLLSELSRVSKVAVITTPNRHFPLEFHTITPFIHWLPQKYFRGFLKLTGRSFYAEEANLNLLDERQMDSLVRKAGLCCEKHHQYLFGIKSNLVYYVY